MHDLVKACAVGSVAVGGVLPVGPAERDAQQDRPVFRNIEEFADEGRIRGQRRLGDGCYSHAFGGQQQVANVDPGVQRAVRALGSTTVITAAWGAPKNSKLFCA